MFFKRAPKAPTILLAEHEQVIADYMRRLNNCGQHNRRLHFENVSLRAQLAEHEDREARRAAGRIKAVAASAAKRRVGKEVASDPLDAMAGRATYRDDHAEEAS